MSEKKPIHSEQLDFKSSSKNSIENLLNDRAHTTEMGVALLKRSWLHSNEMVFKPERELSDAPLIEEMEFDEPRPNDESAFIS